MKQKYPIITLREVQEVIKDKGINLSTTAIWKIWKKYGLAGFKEKENTLYYGEYIEPSGDVYEKLKVAEEFFKEGNIKKIR